MVSILSGPSAFAAEWILNPRYDIFRGNDFVINRGLLQSTFSAENNGFSLYLDGFGEYDGAPQEQRDWRRQFNRGVLQEGYVDYANEGFFLKVGRQAQRWSDSWIVPSLDVWTARRYDRMFVDPLPMQLSHSTGATMSIVQQKWSVDLSAMTDVPQDTNPQPFPEAQPILNPDPINAGVRAKADLFGVQTSVIAARVLRKTTGGLALNYAFESWVPKFETGVTIDEQDDFRIANNRMSFGSLGADIFLGDLILTPQITVVEGQNPSVYPAVTQAISYLSGVYTYHHHEFQGQGFYYSDKSSWFWGAMYTYTWKKWSFSALFQNYWGQEDTLTGVIWNNTGGIIGGLRVQLSTDILKKGKR